MVFLWHAAPRKPLTEKRWTVVASSAARTTRTAGLAVDGRGSQLRPQEMRVFTQKNDGFTKKNGGFTEKNAGFTKKMKVSPGTMEVLPTKMLVSLRIIEGFTKKNGHTTVATKNQV